MRTWMEQKRGYWFYDTIIPTTEPELGTKKLPSEEEEEQAKAEFKSKTDMFFDSIDGQPQPKFDIDEENGQYSWYVTVKFYGQKKALSDIEERKFDTIFDQVTEEAPEVVFTQPKELDPITQHADYFRKRLDARDPEQERAELLKTYQILGDRASRQLPWSFTTTIENTHLKGHAMLKAKDELWSLLRGRSEEVPGSEEEPVRVLNLFQINTVKIESTTAEPEGEDSWNVTINFSGELEKTASPGDLKGITLRETNFSYEIFIPGATSTERADIEAMDRVRPVVQKAFVAEPKPQRIWATAKQKPEGVLISMIIRGIPVLNLDELRGLGISPTTK